MEKFGHQGRLEDERMLKGAGRYVSDWNLPNQAYGHFLRSDRAHAEIASIDASAALEMPGVIAVLTGEDVAAAGHKPMPAAAPMKGRGGAEQKPTPRYSLAREKVRYVGEPVALVVARSAAEAQDAAEAIVVDFNELPAVVTAQEALAAGAAQLHAEVPGNLVLDYTGGDEAATNTAFAKAARVVKLSAYHSRVVGNPMEPRAAMGSFEPASGIYYLHATTQGVGPMRAQCAAMLGVPPEKIRVVAEEVGGGFGVRFNAYPEYGALLLAAQKLGRPVKWVGSRSEVFLGDEQARDIHHLGEIALDAGGKILGMRFTYLANLGAYVAFTGAFVNTMNMVNVISGVYDVQAVHVQGKLVLTNTVPTAAYRGAGRPVASYALERLIDEAAHAIGMDAAEFRRKNLVPTSKFPYKIVSGFEYDCGDFEGMLAQAKKEADWDGFPARRAASARNGKLRGRGIATYIEATAAGGFAPYDQVVINWEKDGAVTLHTASHNHGQGHETTFAQIVGNIFGIPITKFRLRTSEPDTNLVANPTGGSRTLHGLGSAMYFAAQEIVQKGLDLAAEELETAKTDLEFREGDYRIKGTDRKIAITALAQKHPGKLDLDFKERPKVPSTFPNGCHIAEVEIEPETGEVEIVSYLACDDAGNLINEQIVHGQMHGGITQGAGHIFHEQAVYDAGGQLLTGSFMDYAMPRPGLVGGLRLSEHPVPTATNPLGAKGVGEAGVTGSMPCLMNAIVDALRQAGVTHFDMPATPQRVWKAIREAKAGKPGALAVPQS
ncbi:MAG TPA: xanthine dehydrogenase family protein molybdopterin-binding subunit [Burkholderiales bacterium]|jgi:carbon-monoxide dehydrogenase large subunit|nr:xanthine dehydrogenase family protein molybdopterin-binding subunit [Burkholderiales bacterium]